LATSSENLNLVNLSWTVFLPAANR